MGGEDADAAGVEALAEAIIAAVPGEGDDAGAAQSPADDSAPRRGGAEDADDEHERLRVRHGSAGRCDRDPPPAARGRETNGLVARNLPVTMHMPRRKSKRYVPQGTTMMHLHDHGQILGAAPRGPDGEDDASDEDDGSPPGAGLGGNRGRPKPRSQAAAEAPLPQEPLNAVQSLAAWCECGVVEMAHRLSGMTEAQRTQLRTDYALAQEC